MISWVQDINWGQFLMVTVVIVGIDTINRLSKLYSARRDLKKFARTRHGNMNLHAIDPFGVIPAYKCTKLVMAFKIGRMDGPLAYSADDENIRVMVPVESRNRFPAEPDGYLVVYEDGFIGYTPAQAFETGYTLIGKPGKKP